MSDNADSASPLDIPVMQRDPALEELSDKVRNGELIGFLEAIAVINYQKALKTEREAMLRKTFLGRLKLLFRRA